MIIGNFHIVGVCVNKSEADAPLVVDSDRVLSLSVSSKLVESIPRRNPKVSKTRCQVDIFELAPRTPRDVWRQPLRLSNRKQILGLSVRERLDHIDHIANVICHVTVVKSTAASRNLLMRRARANPQFSTLYASVKSGSRTISPPFMADWCAQMPTHVQLALVTAFGRGSRSVASAATNSLTRCGCEPPWPPP